MATGGAADEEELYSFELFECSVCLECLINKQPRLLTCGHTFCTPCLQKLSTGNRLNCPKCRSLTRVPPEGIQALAKNTDIIKMREREMELSSRNEYYCQMCRRKDAKVEFFCTVCPKGHACQACYHKHQRIPALKSQQIFPLEKKLPVDQCQEKCKDHKELLEYFCTSCEEPICVVCTCGPQHEEHCDDIVEFKTGLQGLKKSMNQLHKELMECAKKVEICTEPLKHEMDALKKNKEELTVKCKDVETILNELKHQLNVLTELEHPVKTTYRELNVHLANVQKRITEINDLNKSSDIEFINRTKECRQNCNHIIDHTQMILNKKIIIPQNIKQNIKIVGDVVQVKTKEVCLKDELTETFPPLVATTEKRQTQSSQQMMHQSPRQGDKDQNKELNNLELLLEMKAGGTTDIMNPSEVVSVGDGTVILVDKGMNYLQRIDTEGKVVRNYHVPLNSQACYISACVDGVYLYVAASDNTITKISLAGSSYSSNAKPEGVHVSYISSIGDSVILISECMYDGRILEYNIETKKVIQRVADVFPGKVYIVEDDTKYIVRCRQRLSSNKTVHIYNRAWNMITKIEKNPNVLTVTPGGCLLLVYHRRVYEYSQDGRMIRRLLNKYKFDEIKDIAYDGQCLWVLEREPHAIKIFMLD